MKYITTIEQVQSWVAEEKKRLEKRKIATQNIQEQTSINGSLLTLNKLKDKISLRKIDQKTK